MTIATVPAVGPDAREDDWIIVGDEAFLRPEWDAIPHGTSSGYVHHGCRCDECRAWHRTYYGKEPS